MTDVFISYSRKDKEFVQRLNDALAKQNRDVWVDWEDIPLTADWWKEIQGGIDAADTFVCIISPDFVRSDVCRDEVDHAANAKKRIVPIVHRELTDENDRQQAHPAVSAHNWIFLREQDDFDANFASMMQALDTDLNYVRTHTRLLVRAREWEGEGRDDSLLLRGNDLSEAEAWLAQAIGKQPEPTPLQTEYIRTSRQKETERQQAELKLKQQVVNRLRYLIAAMAVFLVVTIGLLLFVVDGQNRLAEATIENTRKNANLYFQEGQYGQAVAEYTRLLELKPDSPDDYSARAEAYVQQGDYAAAVADYTHALDLKPGTIETYLNRADVYLQQKDYPAAIADYTQVINLQPDNAEAYFRRGHIYAAQENFQEAIANYDRVLELKPEDTKTYNDRGVAYAVQEQYEQALMDFDRALELDPNDAEAYNNQGLLYAAQSDFEGAVSAYTQALRLASEFADAYNNRGLAYMGQIQDAHTQEEFDLFTSSALNDFSRAIVLAPDFADPYINHAQVNLFLGDYMEAIDNYSEYIRLEPESVDGYNNRGLAYAAQNNYQQAIADYDRALELDPELADAYNNRGLAYAAQSNYQQAIVDYDQALELDPELADAYNNRGLAYAAQSNYRRAITDYDRALELNPEFADAYNNRGLAYLNQSDYEQAVSDFLDATDLWPDFIEAYANLEKAYAGQGAFDEAAGAYNQVVDLAGFCAVAVVGLPDVPTVRDVNVRTGPATTHDVVMKVPVGLSDIPVLAVASDTTGTSFQGKIYTWVEVSLPGGVGWIRDDLLSMQGNCTNFGYGIISEPTPIFTLTGEIHTLNADGWPHAVGTGTSQWQLRAGEPTLFTYQGQAGERLTVQVAAYRPVYSDDLSYPDGLDTVLTILSADGEVLVENDDIEPKQVTDSSVENLVLPEDGTYQVEVSSYSDQMDGPFILSVESNPG